MFETDIERYYRETFLTHGDSPKGVDWKDEASQHLRFSRILNLIPAIAANDPLSVLDVGCGTGAIIPLLRARFGQSICYTGIDFVAEMARCAREKYPDCQFHVGGLDVVSGNFDIVLASGIFNVKQSADESAWREFMWSSVDAFYNRSNVACIFNVLTSHVDFRIDRLYYSNAMEMFEHCVPRLTRHAKIDHAYPLYEYTMVLYKRPQLD